MKKYSVTIGIVAYNEEKNIQNLLRSILMQKVKNIEIEKILVCLDGCTDSTVSEVKKVKNTRIELLDHKQRKGKTQRLNEIFTLLQSDILILFDADVILANEDTCTNLIMSLTSMENGGLVSGKPVARDLHTFIEKAINISIAPYQQFAEVVYQGRNIYSCKGAILAMSKKFAKTVRIPEDVFANDTYLYFSCLKYGFDYGYAKNAIVWYELPKTLQDHIKQNTRFIAAGDTMKKYFGNVVDREFGISKKYLYYFLLRQLILHPIGSLAIAMINVYCRIHEKQIAHNIKPAWNIAESTKQGKQI